MLQLQMNGLSFLFLKEININLILIDGLEKIQ